MLRLEFSDTNEYDWSVVENPSLEQVLDCINSRNMTKHSYLQIHLMADGDTKFVNATLEFTKGLYSRFSVVYHKSVPHETWYLKDRHYALPQRHIHIRSSDGDLIRVVGDYTVDMDETIKAATYFWSHQDIDPDAGWEKKPS